MTFSQLITAAPRGMLISVVVAFVLMNGLGVWQFQRMRWKESVIAAMDATYTQSPRPVMDVLMQGKPEWRSVDLGRCPLDGRRVIYMHSELAGQPGYRVLTSCNINSPGAEILVDLGFSAEKGVIPNGMNLVHEVGRLRLFEKPGMVTPVNRPADDDWYWRSAKDMAPALRTHLRDDAFVVIDLQKSGLTLKGLQQAPLNPQVSVPPERHLEYALTWFGLAWVLLGMFGAFAWQRARGK